MASGLVGRALAILELLAQEPSGIGVQALAEKMQMPLASMHRLLGELAQHGYVRQIAETQKYRLTTKLVSLGFQSLSASGIVDLAQPILDRLALASKELVRLAIVDGSRLTWIAKAQGAGSGLRYDPDMGQEAALFCTSAGHAWLAFLEEDEALRIVASQGFGKLNEYGPNAPRSISALIKRLRETRERGYATVFDSAAVGTSAMAAPIKNLQTGEVVGTVTIAGPSARLDKARMAELVPEVLRAASDLASACQFVGYFQSVDKPRSKASV
jgi:IclR family acetate operon transcriptional repressor